MKPKKYRNDAACASYDEMCKRLDAEFTATCKRFDERYAARAIEILEGRNRRVYVMRNHVVKVPLNSDGIADNDWEGSVSNGPTQTGDYFVRYARTRMVVVDGVPVVFMERVKPATSKTIRRRIGRVPAWTDQVDCGQVGFNKRGALVAYDYGPR